MYSPWPKSDRHWEDSCVQPWVIAMDMVAWWSFFFQEHHHGSLKTGVILNQWSNGYLRWTKMAATFQRDDGHIRLQMLAMQYDPPSVLGECHTTSVTAKWWLCGGLRRAVPASLPPVINFPAEEATPWTSRTSAMQRKRLLNFLQRHQQGKN